MEGTPIRRDHNHQLCRVYYSSSEKPEEVWAELADGSCRWRQTGSEIKIICLKVPLDSLAYFLSSGCNGCNGPPTQSWSQIMQHEECATHTFCGQIAVAAALV